MLIDVWWPAVASGDCLPKLLDHGLLSHSLRTQDAYSLT